MHGDGAGRRRKDRGKAARAFEGKVCNDFLVPFKNHEIKAGERVCQMIIDKLPDVELLVVDELSETERGASGFGSTGLK